MQLKDRIVIKIESVAFGGEGVGRVDNFVVFIPFAAPEDELEVEIVQLKKKFARGKILQIVKLSPMRINPLCRYYENCGGCCYQHLNYEYQLEIKKKQVEEIFRKIGKIATPHVGKTIAASNVYNYRGKAELHSSITSNGCKIGFLDVSGGEIVDIERCEIMEETINDKLRILRQNKQQLRNNDARLIIWSGLLADQKDAVMRMIKGKKFLVQREGFFQANLYLTDQLVDEVCRLAESQEMNILIDAYCGSGLFSIFLAPYAQSVVGIEISEKSVKYAQINAANADVKNVRFIRGKVENILPGEFLFSKKESNLIVLDPPRSGCSESVLKTIADLKPRKVIYVSCNPATQARDIKYLNKQGYELLSLMPMDMFPQTEHIETIGFLVLK